MYRRICLLLPCLLLSLPAFAGERYTYSIETQGGLLERVVTGKVVVDGDRYRIEYDRLPDQSNPFDVLISPDGGKTETALLLKERTFYTPKKPPSPGTTSMLFGLFPVFSAERSASNIELAVTPQQELETVSGLPARRHDIRLSYDIAVQLFNEKIRGKVRMEASFWMAEERSLLLPPFHRAEVRTGFPEIDRKLAAELSKLRGIPVKRRTTVTAEADSSTPPRSETVTVTILGLGAPAGQPQR
jgi:hypothetical protein